MNIWTCLRCGKCCKSFVCTGPEITDREKTMILNYINKLVITPHLNKIEFNLEDVKNHLHEKPYLPVLGVKPPKKCVFLSDNICLIHKVKPQICRNYPIELLNKTKIIVDLDCPRGRDILNELENGRYPTLIRKKIRDVRNLRVEGRYFFDEKIKDLS
ncbi:MAG: YkgJ family cysteine cluster protein [Methanobacteriota archaeon]